MLKLMIKCMRIEDTDKCSAQSNNSNRLKRIKKGKNKNAKWNSDLIKFCEKMLSQSHLSELIGQGFTNFYPKHVVQCDIEDALN
jgi:hypothetical protein